MIDGVCELCVSVIEGCMWVLRCVDSLDRSNQ